MLKGGALLYVIFISLIMTIIASSLILLSQYKNSEISDYNTIEKLSRNVTSGLNLLLVNQNIAEGDSITIDLFDTGEDSVQLKVDSWGFYKLLSCKAQERRFQSSKIILAGMWKKNRPALVLENTGTALSLAGSSTILGDCFLPSKSVAYSYIENHRFIGKELNPEIIFPSNSIRDSIDTDFIKNLFGQIDDSEVLDRQLDWNQFLDSASISNSFFNQTKIIYSSNKLDLNEKKIMGNIMIASQKSINVHSTCNLEDVILIAPKIIIEDSFRGSIQCIASDSIILGEKVLLQYPSILSVIRKNRTRTNGYIKLTKSDTLYGDIFLSDSYEDSQKFNSISIKNNSFVQGQIFTTGFSEINSNVVGSVYSRKIVLTTPSSTYDNVLLDSQIDSKKISNYYLSGCYLTGGQLKTLKQLR